MIPRYSRPEMSRLWTPEHRFARWLEVELAAGRAMAKAGLVPAEAIEECAQKGGTFSAQRIEPRGWRVRYSPASGS